MENTSSSIKRVRRSRAEIEGLLEAFERSGATQQAFCRDNGLSVATFSNWRRKAGHRCGPESVLRPVRLTGAASGPGVAVRLPDGTEIFFPAGSESAQIAAVVKTLSAGVRC